MQNHAPSPVKNFLTAFFTAPSGVEATVDPDEARLVPGCPRGFPVLREPAPRNVLCARGFAQLDLSQRLLQALSEFEFEGGRGRHDSDGPQ